MRLIGLFGRELNHCLGWASFLSGVNLCGLLVHTDQLRICHTVPVLGMTWILHLYLFLVLQELFNLYTSALCLDFGEDIISNASCFLSLASKLWHVTCIEFCTYFLAWEA